MVYNLPIGRILCLLEEAGPQAQVMCQAES
jgi:hypothetical protein